MAIERTQPRIPGRLTASMDIVDERSKRAVASTQVRFLNLSMTGAQLTTRALPPALFSGLRHRAFALQLGISVGGELLSVAANVVWAKETSAHTTLGIRWPSALANEQRQKLCDWMAES